MSQGNQNRNQSTDRSKSGKQSPKKKPSRPQTAERQRKKETITKKPGNVKSENKKVNYTAPDKSEENVATDSEVEVNQNYSHRPDDHQQFFRSLMPSLQKFDEEETLVFRKEIIELIQKVKSQGSTLERPKSAASKSSTKPSKKKTSKKSSSRKSTGP